MEMKEDRIMAFSKESLLKNHVGEDDISGFLAEGTEISGEIRFRNVLRVDGKISGKVISERELVIGETGVVDAEIEVGILSVSGKVTGKIHVKEKVEIHPTGRVVGDLSIEKPHLVIHEGGVFEGNVDMNAGKRKDARAGQQKEGALEPIRMHGTT